MQAVGGLFRRILPTPAAAHPVPWRRSYSLQDGLVFHHDDLPKEMENPYKELPKKCILCGISIDYKNTQLLSQFISPYTGRIYGRHITGFMPVTYKHPAFRGDPKICDIRHPE
ncbi:28S ribosomal protein S18c, mitochondrial isoform X2 [Rhinatrema bivittatum]|uniref:28S ribosomal protein S18c, mitochondrial isoform X2 n=1 Tax=Rhinatrema bivittatum TaxID=194408 RepID=UPI00112D3C94|nr:28S ribosomal protein S18c, mitochondrial isoform X2 [Rhinatrema bivittatum]